MYGVQYASLFESYRDAGLLQRIEQYARWTSPSVFATAQVEQHGTPNMAVQYDSQSVGAFALNKLGARLTRTMFPANTPFFSISLTDEEAKRIAKQEKIDNIVVIENAACRRLFNNASYAQLIQCIRLLIVTGDALLYRFNNRLRVYSLRDYSIKRNNIGEVLDIIICEIKYVEELSEETRNLIRESKGKVKLYTRVQRTNNNVGGYFWKVTQQIKGLDIGTDETYTDKLCPYIPVVWNFINGDNYGRGYVEEYTSDFERMSELYASLTDYELEMLRLMHLAESSSNVDLESLTTAPSGTVVEGDPQKISPYEGGSYQKVSVIQNELQMIERRINEAFMVAQPRDSERTTAYEIRQQAEEAEQVLGGVYSQLSEHLHLPLAYILLNEDSPDIMEAFAQNEIELKIVTGIASLSRNTENQGLVVGCSELNTIAPLLSKLDPRFNMFKIAERVFLANGVDFQSLLFTEEEMQAKAQEQQALAQEQQAEQMQMAGMGSPQGGIEQLGGQEQAVSALGMAQGSVG